MYQEENDTISSKTFFIAFCITMVVGVLVLLALFWFSRPLPTPEQIAAQNAAEIAQEESQHKMYVENEELRQKAQAAKGDAQKAAETVSGTVNTAIGAYAFIKVLDIMTR